MFIVELFGKYDRARLNLVTLNIWKQFADFVLPSRYPLLSTILPINVMLHTSKYRF